MLQLRSVLTLSPERFDWDHRRSPQNRRPEFTCSEPLGPELVAEGPAESIEWVNYLIFYLGCNIETC